jgi:inorganic triphosphatase YgiF
MQHLEVETKFEITAADFERLQSIGRVSRREDQLNVYYDAQWTLAERSATLRIRFNDASDPVLTLKVPVSHDGVQRVMREFEVTLPRCHPSLLPSPHPTSIDVERELPEQIRDYLLCLGVTRVNRVGWVRNTRLVLEIADIGRIELDRLCLPDGSVVHEAEIETSSASVQERLARLVCSYVPAARPSSVSKFQRFHQAATSAASSP